MENEKLTYINSRGERLELGVDSVYHCNISKDVEGISGVTSVIYSTSGLYRSLTPAGKVKVCTLRLIR